MKATMKEVAELAGVGLGTVSRVVNGVKVKESTYRKVQDAIEALHYQPDEYARGLKTNKSHIIALIIPTIWHPFFSEFAYHVEKELSSRHYKLFICNAEENGEKEFEYLQMLEKNKVDGIIGITYSDIDQYVSSNLPFVSIDRHFSEKIPYVTADNYRGGQLAAETLLEKGAKHFAYIGGLNRFENETIYRKMGFYNRLEEEGYSVKKLDMLEPIEDLECKIRNFLLENPEIDGIFTVNDFMGLTVMEVAQSLGKVPPHDYQIIGFDGLKMAIDKGYILSTIVQPLEQMAQAAVALLMDVMEQRDEKTRIVLPVSFAEGGTTK
ncbi:LacI family DNA-binding transcriptional regulator [Streptococcus sp. DD13]|uniref:LacI family DNA-binding transcriptional regulator n=1 Tax=Streptococcus sp. DD13 TaxID=1777881 RepID=UPI0007937A73|nr:LacI family DNA-binding transcriptional regulator [Streptococcus sp. DD13]KXT78088.1 Sucrose operon repressor (SCR operon regulatory protein) [Streptococcus sp. DD13]